MLIPLSQSRLTVHLRSVSMDYADMQLKEISTLDGVKDLTLKVRGRFAQALKAEAKGEHDKAAKALDEAVEAESSL